MTPSPHDRAAPPGVSPALAAAAQPGPAPASSPHEVSEAGPGTPGSAPRPAAAQRQAAKLATLADSMSEALLDQQVRTIAASLGLLRYHTHNSRRSEPGFPDLVIVGTRVLWRELKTQRGTVTATQRQWIHALTDAGQDAAVWRPGDLLSGRVARELAAVAGLHISGAGEGG